MPAAAPRGAAQPGAQPQHAATDDARQHPEPGLNEIRRGEHRPGQRRQAVAEIVEQGLELGHDKGQHHHHGEHRHEQQNAGVEQRREHAVPIGPGLIQMRHQAIEHGGHLTAGLAAAHHADIEAPEQIGVGLQGQAQRFAVFYGLENIGEQSAHGGRHGHLDQHFQGAVQGQPGAQQHGQLRGHGQHVAARGRAAAAAREGAARHLGLQGQQGQAAGAQLARGELLAGGFEGPIDGFAVAGERAIVEQRHGVRPAEATGGGSRQRRPPRRRTRTDPGSRAAPLRGTWRPRPPCADRLRTA